MKISRRLKNIQPELDVINEKASNELGIDIVSVVETGRESSEHEKKVQNFIGTEDNSYDHRPRRYIGIYPNITALNTVLFNKENGSQYEFTSISVLIDDMLNTVNKKFNEYPTFNNEDPYSNVLLELDTNYVRRLSALKNEGTDVLFHLKRDILTALQDIQDDYMSLAKKVTDNIMVKSYSVENLIKKDKYDNTPYGPGESKQDIVVSDKKMIHTKIFLMMLDLTLAWYINYKIVQQRVYENDFFNMIADIYERFSYVRRRKMAFYFKIMVTSGVTEDDKLIDIIIKKLSSRLYDNSAYETIELKYTPIYFQTDDNNELVSSGGQKPSKSNLYNECRNDFVSFGLDTPDVIRYISECYQIGSETLIQEGVLDKFIGSDADRIIELAREIDQVQTEFDFMYDKYSKADALNRAYDCLKKIDKAKRRARNRKDKETLDELRTELLDIIKKQRERDIKKERMTININYPEGYEG